MVHTHLAKPLKMSFVLKNPLIYIEVLEKLEKLIAVLIPIRSERGAFKLVSFSIPWSKMPYIMNHTGIVYREIQ